MTFVSTIVNAIHIMKNACYIFLTSQEISAIFWKAQKVKFLSCDWWILIHFLCFCFKKIILIIIDRSIIIVSWALDFRVHVFELRCNNTNY